MINTYQAQQANIAVFTNPAFGNVRIIHDERGDLLFVAKDVAEALGYSSTSLETPGKLFDHVPDEWKGRKPIPVRSENGVIQDREILCLTEQGLYFFLARSDKPSALPFQRWLAGDVVPSIRRNGMYATPQTVEAMLADPDTTIRILTELKAERQRSRELASQVAIDRPKVVFADAVDASKTAILIGDFAKILRQNGISMGQNRLFEWMRERGFLMKHGDSRNMPTQRSMEMKLFEIKERTINNPDGSIRITKTPKLTGKGQIYFVNLFTENMGTGSCSLKAS